MPIHKFSEETKDALGNYVYCLCSVIGDQRSIFYIGEGRGDRVFEHENTNYSDFTNKGIEISRILSEGGIIEKYILDCQIENSSNISGQAIAFHAENALINLAKLSGLDIHNSQVGHGFPKSAMTVEEIEALYSKDSIAFDIFNSDDKVVIFRFSYHNQSIFNAVDSEEKIKSFLFDVGMYTRKERELPSYICIVYRSVIKRIYKINTELEVIPPKNEKGRTLYKLNIESLEPTLKYANYIGRSFGKLVPAHGHSYSPIYTYDQIYLNKESQ